MVKNKIEVFISSLEIRSDNLTIRLKKPLRLKSKYIDYKDEKNENEYYIYGYKPFCYGYGRTTHEAYKEFQELFCLEYLTYKLGNYNKLGKTLKKKIEEYDKLIKWVHYKINDVEEF